MELREHFTITAIIAITAAVFLYQLALGDDQLTGYETVPVAVVGAWDAVAEGGLSRDVAGTFVTLFTATLLHAGADHIVYNLVFLWLFGSLVSRLLGPWWALGVFVATGVAGSVAHVVLNRESPIPMLGASGAVCGYEGVYLGLALQWRLEWPDVWPLARPIPPMQLAALAVIGFLFDVYGLMQEGHGVAFGAHIGGLLMGILIAAAVTTIYPTEQAFARSTLAIGRRTQ